MVFSTKSGTLFKESEIGILTPTLRLRLFDFSVDMLSEQYGVATKQTSKKTKTNNAKPKQITQHLN